MVLHQHNKRKHDNQCSHCRYAIPHMYFLLFFLCPKLFFFLHNTANISHHAVIFLLHNMNMTIIFPLHIMKHLRIFLIINIVTLLFFQLSATIQKETIFTVCFIIKI